jgi:hypothetical protein
LDSLFKDYGNPTILLDGLISSCQFCDWLDAQYENKEEKTMWEYYIHKLGAWDNRSFDEFKHDVTKGRPAKIDIPTEEQTSATIKKSFEMFKHFEISEERSV